MTQALSDVDLAISRAKQRGLSVKAFCAEIGMPYLPGAGWMFARAQFAGSGKLAADCVRKLHKDERRMRCECGKVRVYPLSAVAKLHRPYRCASCAKKAQWTAKNA